MIGIDNFFILGIAFFLAYLYAKENNGIFKVIWITSSLSFALVSLLSPSYTIIGYKQNYIYNTANTLTAINTTYTYGDVVNPNFSGLGDAFMLIFVVYLITFGYILVMKWYKLGRASI
jgi:hypothetical protein